MYHHFGWLPQWKYWSNTVYEFRLSCIQQSQRASCLDSWFSWLTLSLSVMSSSYSEWHQWSDHKWHQKEPHTCHIDLLFAITVSVRCHVTKERAADWMETGLDVMSHKWSNIPYHFQLHRLCINASIAVFNAVAVCLLSLLSHTAQAAVTQMLLTPLAVALTAKGGHPRLQRAT